jgi:hypothetical protein
MIRYLTQGAPQGYETVYTGDTTIGTFAGYNSPTANVQVFHGPTAPGAAPYTWVKPTSGTFARVECVAGGAGGSSYQGAGGPSSSIIVFLNSTGTGPTALLNGDTITTANMASIGVTYTGSVTSHTVPSVGPALLIITAGSGLACTVTPKPNGTILYTSNVAGAVHSAPIVGVYGRGHGGSGGGSTFAIIPLTELPPTVPVSVGGGGGGSTGTNSGGGTNSSFGTLLTAQGGAFSSPTGSGAGGFAYASGPNGGTPSNVIGGGGGTPATTRVATPFAYSAFGGGGGGNENAPGTPSVFAGSGGTGATNTAAVQDGEYPGGGGSGGIFSSVGGGKGAAGRVRIIVY